MVSAQCQVTIHFDPPEVRGVEWDLWTTARKNDYKQRTSRILTYRMRHNRSDKKQLSYFGPLDQLDETLLDAQSILLNVAEEQREAEREEQRGRKVERYQQNSTGNGNGKHKVNTTEEVQPKPPTQPPQPKPSTQLPPGYLEAAAAAGYAAGSAAAAQFSMPLNPAAPWFYPPFWHPPPPGFGARSISPASSSSDGHSDDGNVQASWARVPSTASTPPPWRRAQSEDVNRFAPKEKPILQKTSSAEPGSSATSSKAKPILQTTSSVMSRSSAASSKSVMPKRRRRSSRVGAWRIQKFNSHIRSMSFQTDWETCAQHANSVVRARGSKRTSRPRPLTVGAR